MWMLNQEMVTRILLLADEKYGGNLDHLTQKEYDELMSVFPDARLPDSSSKKQRILECRKRRERLAVLEEKYMLQFNSMTDKELEEYMQLVMAIEYTNLFKVQCIVDVFEQRLLYRGPANMPSRR